MHNQIYIGSTKDLRKRLKEHNDAKEISTKRYYPWELIYYEAFKKEENARLREQQLKYHGNAIRELKKRIGLTDLRNGAGFTLIELVVAFSIIAVLSTIGVAAFLNYSRSQTLQQATNDLITTLNVAKSKAIAQIKPNDARCLPDKVLSGYKVVLNTGQYTLYAVCGNGVNVPIPPATDTTPITAKLPKGVSFDSSMTLPMTITFGVLTGGVVGSGSIILDGVGVTTGKTITITKGGLIE